jgi:hypothetical protein
MGRGEGEIDEVARRYGVTPDQLEKILGAQERKKQKNKAKRARKRGGATGEDGNYEIIEEGRIGQNGTEDHDRVRSENRGQGTVIPPSGFVGETSRNQGGRNEARNRSSTPSNNIQRSETPAPTGILRRPSRGIGERGGDDSIPLTTLNDSTPQRRPLVLTTEEYVAVTILEQQSRNRNNQRERTSIVSPAPTQRRAGRGEQWEGRLQDMARHEQASDLISRYDEISDNPGGERVPHPATRPHISNPHEGEDDLDDLPELEEMPRPVQAHQSTTVWNQQTSAPRANVWVNLPVGNLAEAKRDLSEYALNTMKEALADGTSFTLTKINGFPKRSEALQVMISLAVHKMAVEAGIEVNNSLFANPGRIVCLTMKSLQSIIQRPDQARQWVKKLHTTDPVSPNLNDVTPITLKHLAGAQHKVLSGQTPPADECIKLLQMVLKRYHPDDYEQIEKAMQEANLAASTYVRFIRMQGEFSQWIGRVMGNEISSFIPRIYRLSKLQEEVDEEENALLEEMSIGRSVASFQVSESGQEPPAAEETIAPEEVGTGLVSRMEQTEEDFARDLHPLDPISTLVERAEREGKEIIIPTKLLLDQSVLNGFEIFQYDQEEVPSTSPIAEANYPYEALEHRYHGVAEEEAKRILIEKVLCPSLENHFSEVKPLLEWHFAAKSYQELTVLCGAPSQLKVAIKELGLAIAVPPRKREHEIQEKVGMDPVYALPKIPTRSILQIKLRENMDPEVLIEKLNEVFESLSPGQEVEIEEKWELMPNLAE